MVIENTLDCDFDFNLEHGVVLYETINDFFTFVE